MAKRPLAAIFEKYEDQDLMRDMVFMGVMFDNQSAARGFLEWVTPKAVDGLASVHRLDKKHWIVAFQSYDQHYPHHEEEIDTRLNLTNTPRVEGGTYAYQCDTEEDACAVLNLAYAREGKVDHSNPGDNAHLDNALDEVALCLSNYMDGARRA